MSTSPKRKSDEEAMNCVAELKKPRLEGDQDQPVHNTDPPAPDSLIDHSVAIAYWTATEASVTGVLGGYPQVSQGDLQGSKNFLARLRRNSKHYPPSSGKLRRAVDCGAGIGRIAEGFLVRVAEEVDVVEPVQKFTDQIKAPAVRRIVNVGLEDWFPTCEDGMGPYDLIWNQWCCGQLTDLQLEKYLARLPAVLSEGGWIVVKENLTSGYSEEDIFDQDDSSVTRSDGKFKAIFDRAGLKIVSSELQKGMPQGLYPVRAYALQPKS